MNADQALNYYQENTIIDTIQSRSRYLSTAMHYALRLGGKRTRPVLAILTQRFFDEKVDNILPLCNAIELFHNFTLVHDDIMDESEMRRNSKTVYKQFSTPVAILTGDALLIKAYQHLEIYNSNVYYELSKILNVTAFQLCDGQQFDIEFENENNITVDAYLEMIRMKTAVLLGATMQMTGVINNQSTQINKKLYEIGVDLGMCFQLNDDYLDTFGGEEFDKIIGNDIVKNKKTYLWLKALELSNEGQRNILISNMNNQNATEKIEIVKSMYIKLGVNENSKILSISYYMRAIEKLESLDINEQAKKNFMNFIEALNHRKK